MDVWAQGTQLGPYVLLAPLGAGGMGEVWQARDTRLDRIVAIKKLQAQHTDRFAQEARAIAALNHPHICQVYDVGPDYLVLEYVEGRQLPCPLPLEEATRFAIDIAAALEAAHRKGIIHRDLKPANIMVTGDKSVKLLDFGLAKLLDPSDSERTRSLEGVVVGTLSYMSPEQAEGKPLDERSDIFSFGAVLYEMLSGNRAFDGDSMVQVLRAVLDSEPAPIGSSSALHRIVKRCLAKQPAQRFQTMREVRLALEQLSAKPAETKPSVAALPFSTMSANKEDEYFSDGLTEEIINALAQIPGLNVTARTSSFAFRGKEQDVRKIAETLDVRNILEGSVRRSGNRIRVTAQLIDAASGYHLWSERYDREMADVFEIQDEISQAIAVALKLKLSPQQSAPRKHTPSLPAHEAFLKARYFLGKLRPDMLQQTKEWLEQAIALDPDFALPHAMLATYYQRLAFLGASPATQILPLARNAALRALEIDPDLAEARAELAVAATLDYDWAEAGRQFAMAMAGDPVPGSVRNLYGFFYLLPLGRLHEATVELETAIKSDPLNVQCQTQLAVCYWVAGNSELAAEQFRRALELDENFWLALMVQSIWHAEEGRLDQARAFAERVYAVAPKNPRSIGHMAGILSLTGELERSRELLQQLGDGTTYGYPFGFVVYHTVRLEYEQAADWAEKAVAQRDPNAIPAICGPNRRGFVAHGRWPKLAQMMNLPQTATGQFV